MKGLGVILAVALTWVASVQSAPAAPAAQVADPPGLHDFDFLVGEWRVHHQIKRATDQPWVKFDGTCSNRGLMAGWANVEDHTFERSTGRTRAVGLRAYDAKTHEWAIWWIDGRDPHLPLDPPVKGHFDNGIGTFYSDSLLNGKRVRTRFIWSHITRVSGHWEQALSYDEGKTWDTNWIMDFQRIS